MVKKSERWKWCFVRIFHKIPHFSSELHEAVRQSWNDFARHFTNIAKHDIIRWKAISFFTHIIEKWKYHDFWKSDKIILAAMLKIISQIYENFFFDSCSIITESEEFSVSAFFLHNSVDKTFISSQNNKWDENCWKLPKSSTFLNYPLSEHTYQVMSNFRLGLPDTKVA